jgi:hypothetical protein
MKSTYRGIDDGELFEFNIPFWAVSVNEATGEYESDFQFNYSEENDTLFPTDESLIQHIDDIKINIAIYIEDNLILNTQIQESEKLSDTPLDKEQDNTNCKQYQ